MYAEGDDGGGNCLGGLRHETCDHSYYKRSHKSHTTIYQSQLEDEWDEVPRKICYIEMVDVAHNGTT